MPFCESSIVSSLPIYTLEGKPSMCQLQPYIFKDLKPSNLLNFKDETICFWGKNMHLGGTTECWETAKRLLRSCQ